MGYGSYQVTRRDGRTITAGYLHEGTCDGGGCAEVVNLGIDALCGGEPGGGESGCGGYFCPDHIAFTGTCASCEGDETDG